MWLLLLLLMSVPIDMYYQPGCIHCIKMENNFKELNISPTMYNIHDNQTNLDKLLNLYREYNISSGGTPTLLIDRKVLIIGEISKEKLISIIKMCEEGRCKRKLYNSDKNINTELTWTVLIGAAIVDSINPCTLAVMTMLLTTILYSRGRKKTLKAGLIFAITIMLGYILYGMGVLKIIGIMQLSNVFYIVITLLALVLGIMEIRAAIDYKPGFLAVEMPMFLRPYAKRVTEEAVSYKGVFIAALLCSIFLVPCSSGPYLMVLSMISNSININTLAYLFVYNLFFIMPMIAITVLIYLGRTTIENITNWREKYIRKIHLISGVILLILFVIMTKQLI